MPEFSYFPSSDFEFNSQQTTDEIILPFSFVDRLQSTTSQPTANEKISTDLNVPYTIFEILVAIFAIIGNLMVIIVFQRERKLRRRTNYYIVSLAMADFLVGLLGVPFAVLASVGLPTNLHACLFTVSLLVVLCTISIFCLVAVSVDRYWAILYPMAYSRNVRTKTAIGIISMCWVAGTIVGFLPLFGWHADFENKKYCLFVEVMDYNYLVFLYFATIITPALLMLAFYAHIYRVIIKQVRQIVTMNPVGDCSRQSSISHIQTTPNRMGQGGTMLRVLGAARKRDVKATQNLSIIVLFFMICWIPLYTINCVKAFCQECQVHPKLTFFCIILSHLNSAVNPVLYAYHLKDFRAALKNLILKVIGIDVEPQPDMTHRFSLASQHRLQSIDKRSSVKTKIYIDSPIWLRQQQRKQQNDDSGLGCEPTLICNSISSVHSTVAAVASATSDLHHNMWKIVEASSTAEHEQSIGNLSGECGGSISANGSLIGNGLIGIVCNKRNLSDHESQYSYDNRNYSSSPDDLDYDDVFLNIDDKMNSEGSMNSSLKCEKLHQLDGYDDEDDDDDISYNIKHKNTIQLLTDSSISDYEIPKSCLAPTICEATVQSYSPISNGTASNHSPLKLIENADCTKYRTTLDKGDKDQQMNSIFVVDSEKNPLSPGHKPRFKKSPRLSITNSNTRTVRKITRSTSCTTDTDLSNNNNHTDKFRPLKAMSNLIFPPVKHSSLFQLFVDPGRDTADCPDIKKRTPSDG